MVQTPGLWRRARGRGQVSGHLEHHACASLYVNHILHGSNGDDEGNDNCNIYSDDDDTEDTNGENNHP